MDEIDRPPFHADEVGSLLRPQHLHDARARFAAGTLDAAELAALEDAAIRDVVAKQEAVGLRDATDGELRRGTWLEFLSSVKGTGPRTDSTPTVRARWFVGEGEELDLAPPGRAPIPGRAPMGINDRVGLDEVVFADHFSFLREACTSAVPKICIPSPSMLHYRGGDAAIDRSVYPDLEEFWSDVVEVWVKEMHGLAALGCTYLQLDDTSLAFLLDPREQEGLRQRGNEPEAQLARYVDTVNRVLARRPEGMAVTLHTCRGNMQSAWASSGGYEPIAESVLGQLEVDGLFLEFDDDRSGSFEPLRFIPKGRRVVLGLVTSKTPALEDKSVLKRRVEEASRYLPMEQLCLSTQCGFASTEPGNKLTEEEQFAKLSLVVETAAEIWGES